MIGRRKFKEGMTSGDLVINLGYVIGNEKINQII